MYDRLSARCFMPYPEVPVPHAKEGPLTGLTFAVKDIFDVAGYPTSAGNPTFLALQGIKQKTASCVEKLLAAGAEFQGKTITDELAFSMQGANFHLVLQLTAAHRIGIREDLRRARPRQCLAGL